MNYVKFGYVISIFLIMLLTTAAKAPRIVVGPKTIPNIAASMLEDDFWIEQLDEPDQVFLSVDQYQQLKATWLNQDIIIDISNFPSHINSFQIKLWLKEDFSYLKRVGRYQEDGRLLPQETFNNIINNVNLKAFKTKQVTSQWGLLVKQATLRLFPTDKIITAKPKDIEFNMLAHSELRLAEPVVVLHHSADKKWLFIASTIGRGWLPSQAIGLAKQKKQVLDYMTQAKKVMIESKTTLNINHNKQEVKMGCWLVPLPNDHVRAPIRLDTGQLEIINIKLSEPTKWSDQFLKSTPRNMIKQAFKLLEQPYGWGGSQGMGDCSELIRRVGLCFGMTWPRSTQGLQQGFYASPIKMSTAPQLKAGQTLLTLPGHVMLVIGQIQSKTYVIHNLYGIHGQDKLGPLIKRVARVIVSDLSLGAASHKGALKNRVNKKIEFSLPPN